MHESLGDEVPTLAVASTMPAAYKNAFVHQSLGDEAPTLAVAKSAPGAYGQVMIAETLGEYRDLDRLGAAPEERSRWVQCGDDRADAA